MQARSGRGRWAALSGRGRLDEMMRIELAKMPARAALRLGLLAGFLVVAGCSEPASGDKRDDPALKASMQKSMEIYKSKTQAKKGNPAAAKTKP
jgi:hypothetical protein